MDDWIESLVLYVLCALDWYRIRVNHRQGYALQINEKQINALDFNGTF